MTTPQKCLCGFYTARVVFLPKGFEVQEKLRRARRRAARAGLVILYSDEDDFSAARWPPELILGPMSTEHTIYFGRESIKTIPHGMLR